SQVQTWINQKLVSVNENTVKANYKCKQGDIIKWSIPEVKPLDVEAENIPLEIIYEDSDLLVVNKPKGMVVHPSAGHHKGTLVKALFYHCNVFSVINGVERPGFFHGIVKVRMGLLVVVKKDLYHRILAM